MNKKIIISLTIIFILSLTFFIFKHTESYCNLVNGRLSNDVTTVYNGELIRINDTYSEPLGILVPTCNNNETKIEPLFFNTKLCDCICCVPK